MTDKDLFGVISVGISIFACVNYIVSILRGKTKPHAFTWSIWSLIMGIIFVAQWNKGAGAGAWAAGSSTFLCLTIFVLSLFRGEKNITKSDCLALLSAFAIIPFWHLTKSALWAVVLATLIDAFAYYPTVRKSWIRPHEENVFMYASDNVRWVFALMAMSDYSTTTLIYPFFCMVANSALTLMILWRRHRQKVNTASPI